MKLFKSLLLCGLFMVGISQANATIDLTSYGSQPGNSGDGTINSWASGLVTAYNNANNPDIPLPTSFAYKVDKNGTPPSGYPSFGNNVITITIPAGGYDYIALHWGNGQTQYPYQLYYIGDDTGSVTFSNSKNGLSSYWLFGPTPDNTVTAVPEPSTFIAAALLLIPVCLPVVRQLRKYKRA